MAWTVSGYLIGFSLSQLLWGPIGDRHGRRLPVAIGLVLFVIGSAGCELAGNVWAMIDWRVVQAVGACAGVVLARAMVRDLFEGDRAAQMLSTRRQFYGTGKQSRSFANATGPEKFLRISDRLCSSLPKVRSIR